MSTSPEPVTLDEERSKLLSQYAKIDLTGEIGIRQMMPAAGGAFADVYQGEWNVPDRKDKKLALKVIRYALLPKLGDKLDVLRKLRQEVSVWRRIDHPNVHPLLGVAWHSAWIFPALVSSWEDNGNMTEYLDQLPPSTPEHDVHGIKVDLLEGVLTGLDYLHANGIIHADIKGTNVLVSSEGIARLCDFGISWTGIKRSVSFTANRRGKGTVTYMAPEVFPLDVNESSGANATYSVASDVWSFGCLLIEVMSGASPWNGRNEGQVHLELAHRRLFSCPPGVDQETWALAKLCCDFDATKRPSVVLVISALQGLRRTPTPVVAIDGGASASLEAAAIDSE